MRTIFIIASLVIFIIAALAAWFINDWNATDVLGLISAGLACFVASFLPFDRIPAR